jgi:hypothetical protein
MISFKKHPLGYYYNPDSLLERQGIKHQVWFKLVYPDGSPFYPDRDRCYVSYTTTIADFKKLVVARLGSHMYRPQYNLAGKTLTIYRESLADRPLSDDTLIDRDMGKVDDGQENLLIIKVSEPVSHPWTLNCSH